MSEDSSKKTSLTLKEVEDGLASGLYKSEHQDKAVGKYHRYFYQNNYFNFAQYKVGKIVQIISFFSSPLCYPLILFA